MRQAKGYVEVDEFQNTKARGIYALGDVVGLVELTPVAIAVGRRLADRLFGGLDASKADYDMVPTGTEFPPPCNAAHRSRIPHSPAVVFSHPTIGTIGLTEEEALVKHGAENIKVYKSTFVNLFYGPWVADSSDKPKTAMKLVCLGKEEKVCTPFTRCVAFCVHTRPCG